MPDLAESKETLDEAIDRAKAAAADLEVNVQKVAANVVDRIGQTARGLISDLLKDEGDLIAALDGWTLDVRATVRLTKPKK